ncbi:MAG TPA: hypothetical protein VJ909_04655 [Prolixibacteraceae bacterium]|nr:hypothetical protein [Prolixibacteraceae bacterium]
MSAKHLLLPFKLFIKKSGANYNQVAQLVNLKLMLDNRRKLPNSGKKAAPKNSIIKQALSFVLVGVFLSLMLLNTNDPYFAIFMFQTMLIIMNSITMLAEYSVSLFDPRENNTLLPLPVNGQTMGWSRVMHILIYLSILSIGMMLPGIVFSYFKFGGITALLFFISVFFNTLFTLFITVYIYLTLIKLMDGEKLKDTMMYVQVALTIIVIVAYQIIPRHFMPENGQESILQPNWYFTFFPPAWFTSFAVIAKQANILDVILAAVGVIVPIASIVFISKKLFYGFNDGLIKMSGQASGKKQAGNVKNKTGLWFNISKTIMGVTKHEYPVFKLIWKLSGRERLFKQSLLPVLSYVVIIPAISIFVTGDMQDTEHKYITFLYFTIMSSSMLPTLLTIGNSKNAKWIFYSLPNVRPDKLFKAAIKVSLTKFFLPAYLIISLPLIYFKGGSAVLDMVTIFLFNCLMTFLIQYMQTPYFMFTREKSAAQGGGTALKMFLAVFAGIPLGFLHAYLVKENALMPIILLVIYTTMLMLISELGFVKRYNWKYVKNANNAF